MIKRIIGNLFAWATLALIVVVALHRDRYTSIVEFWAAEPAAAGLTSEPAAETPATAPSGLSAAPDSVALPAAEVQPAAKADSAGMAAAPTAVPHSDTTASDTTVTVPTDASSSAAPISEAGAAE